MLLLVPTYNNNRIFGFSIIEGYAQFPDKFDSFPNINTEIVYTNKLRVIIKCLYYLQCLPT